MPLHSRATVVTRSPVVCPSVSFCRKPPSGLTPNFGDSYLSAISPDYFLLLFFFFCLFCFVLFSKILNFLHLFFVFVDMGPYWENKLQTTSPLKVQFRFIPKISCILLGRVSTKVVQRIVKFQILGVWHFCFRSC